MKSLRTSVLSVCVTLCSLCLYAQTEKIPLNEPDLNKPQLFANLPESFQVPANKLAALLTTDAGAKMAVDLSINIKLEGQIVSSAISETDKVQKSIVLRSSNYNGALLTISRVVDPSTGHEFYTGRILSMKHRDLYVLQNVNGQYSFVKKDFYTLVNE